MPGATVWLVRPYVSQHAVRPSAFFCVRQVHHRRAHQRVAECESMGCLIHERESRLLGRRKVPKVCVRAYSVCQDAHVSRAI